MLGWKARLTLTAVIAAILAGPAAMGFVAWSARAHRAAPWFPPK